MFYPKAIINLDNLAHNYRLIKDQLNNIPIMAVVKANAYGHGVIEISKVLRNEGVKFFAVFTFNEALELRDAGITEDILVFCRPTKQMLDIAFEKDITLNLCDPDDVRLFCEANHSPKFHLKVDTGMTRLGISFNEVYKIIETIKNEKLNCHGIYSHYATADEGDLSYAEYQLDQFNELLEFLEKINLTVKFIHFSNSGTVINMPHSSYNLVRVGMLLYGSFPSDEVPRDLSIKPVMEFKGPVVSLRKVKAGTKVSYGGIWEANEDTVIGVVQTGFADGFPRGWYMNGFISLRVNKHPIAGRVCMDQFMVDFGDAEVEVGDEVLIFGQNEVDKILVDDIAKDIGSTSYVILTGIRGRTERKYIN
jgi:alanine racemase